MCGNKDSGNSMPESAKAVQAVECLADIRERGGTSSGIVVFDFEQRDGGNEQRVGTPVGFSNLDGQLKSSES